jgi:capsular polysaccharide transport system permease protein
MEIENGPRSDQGSVSALERARIVSQALSEAARRVRLSTRRRVYSSGGFHARRGARAMRLAMLVSFYLMVVVPSLCGFIYYGFLASDQFVSETKFTISGGDAPMLDGIGALTGVPAISVVQDTQIVVKYIEGRAALEQLEKAIGVRELYARPEADWLARFNPDQPIEKFVKYWRRMATASIIMPAGIVDVKVRAFTPRDASKIATAVIAISETLINDMNDRMHRDAIANAEQEFNRTAARLTEARIALEKARNEEGLLDADKAGEALNKLLTDSRGSLLRLQQEYASQLASVLESAPQMVALKSRIDATKGQIAEIESKLTTTELTSASQPTLAVSMTKFAKLDLERQIAERLYSGAAASLEAVRLTADQKLMYINTFVRPSAPQEAQYPQRRLDPILILVGSLALWGICCGLLALVRNHMA